MTTRRGRCITPSDPLHDLALITVVKRPSRVVIPVASTPKISAGVHRDHFQDTSATRTLVAHLSHLLDFNVGHSFSLLAFGICKSASLLHGRLVSITRAEIMQHL